MPTKIKITNLHPKDAWYGDRSDFIGAEGWADNFEHTGANWYKFDFTYLNGSHGFSFMYAEFYLVR